MFRSLHNYVQISPTHSNKGSVLLSLNYVNTYYKKIGVWIYYAILRMNFLYYKTDNTNLLKTSGYYWIKHKFSNTAH